MWLIYAHISSSIYLVRFNTLIKICVMCELTPTSEQRTFPIDSKIAVSDPWAEMVSPHKRRDHRLVCNGEDLFAREPEQKLGTGHVRFPDGEP